MGLIAWMWRHMAAERVPEPCAPVRYVPDPTAATDPTDPRLAHDDDEPVG